MSSLRPVDVLAFDNDQGSQFLGITFYDGCEACEVCEVCKVCEVCEVCEGWMRREDVCRAWRSRVVKRREKRREKKRDGLGLGYVIIKNDADQQAAAAAGKQGFSNDFLPNLRILSTPVPCILILDSGFWILCISSPLLIPARFLVFSL